MHASRAIGPVKLVQFAVKWQPLEFKLAKGSDRQIAHMLFAR